MPNFFRALCFVVFFSVGAAAICGSILCDEIVGYYNNRQLLAAAEETSHKLQSLNSDYDALLEQLQQDPNLFNRIAPAALGIKPAEDPNTVYPSVKAEELAAARKALTEQTDDPNKTNMPQWLKRCSEPRKKMGMFLSGTFLTLVAFIFFRAEKEQFLREQKTS